MKQKLTLAARLLLGFVFFASGVAGLFKLVPTPENLPEALVTYTKGLEASIYFMPFLKITEIVCGLMLLTGFFVPLALVILAPIVLNIFLVHAFIAPDGVILGVVMCLLMIYLSFFAQPYSQTIKMLFKK